jgi:hypothetical protein
MIVVTLITLSLRRTFSIDIPYSCKTDWCKGVCAGPAANHDYLVCSCCSQGQQYCPNYPLNYVDTGCTGSCSALVTLPDNSQISVLCSKYIDISTSACQNYQPNNGYCDISKLANTCSRGGNGISCPVETCYYDSFTFSLYARDICNGVYNYDGSASPSRVPSKVPSSKRSANPTLPRTSHPSHVATSSHPTRISSLQPTSLDLTYPTLTYSLSQTVTNNSSNHHHSNNHLSDSVSIAISMVVIVIFGMVIYFLYCRHRNHSVVKVHIESSESPHAINIIEVEPNMVFQHVIAQVEPSGGNLPRVSRGHVVQAVQVRSGDELWNPRHVVAASGNVGSARGYVVANATIVNTPESLQSLPNHSEANSRNASTQRAHGHMVQMQARSNNVTCSSMEDAFMSDSHTNGRRYHSRLHTSNRTRLTVTS